MNPCCSYPGLPFDRVFVHIALVRTGDRRSLAARHSAGERQGQRHGNVHCVSGSGADRGGRGHDGDGGHGQRCHVRRGGVQHLQQATVLGLLLFELAPERHRTILLTASGAYYSFPPDAQADLSVAAVDCTLQNFTRRRVIQAGPG